MNQILNSLPSIIALLIYNFRSKTEQPTVPSRDLQWQIRLGQNSSLNCSPIVMTFLVLFADASVRVVHCLFR
jgi:hypothetical protein